MGVKMDIALALSSHFGGVSPEVSYLRWLVERDSLATKLADTIKCIMAEGGLYVKDFPYVENILNEASESQRRNPVVDLQEKISEVIQ